MEFGLGFGFGFSGFADAHRDDGRRFIVRADEILTAFLELHAAIHRQLELG